MRRIETGCSATTTGNDAGTPAVTTPDEAGSPAATRRNDAGRAAATTRGEQGLATLSWLLIVAAVAGLAALAVVLVYYFVEDTGDRFVAPNPRRTAAQFQAADVEVAAKAAEAGDFATWDEWERHFSGKCSRIAITIGDERITISANHFIEPNTAKDFDHADSQTALRNADKQGPGTNKAQVNCTVQ